MSTNKTVPNKSSVTAFIREVEDPLQREDSKVLVRLMHEVTGESAVMWGPSIIGFGRYHYRYESGREGTMLMVGFSPRKGKLALYVGALSQQNKPLLPELGNHKTGKSCLYIKRLEDVDLRILRQIIENTYRTLKTRYQ